MSQRVIVIFESETGRIRQVTKCPEEDAEIQHLAWPGCGFVDVTDSAPNATPYDHAIDLQTMEIVERALANDGDKEAKRRELVEAAASVIAAVAPADVTSMLLLAASGDAEAQASARDYAAARGAAQQKLAALLDTLPNSETRADVAAIAWD